MDWSLPAEGSWALVAAIAVTVGGYALFRRWRAADARAEEDRKHAAQYKAALAAWKAAVRSGSAAAVYVAKKKLDEMKKRGWDKLALLMVLLTMCSCASTPEPKPETVVLTEHVVRLAPGDQVPELPEGEFFWWVCTPTGLESLLPAGSLVLEE